MSEPADTNRRTVLKTAGSLVAGSALLAGAGAATDGPAMLAETHEGDDEESDADGRAVADMVAAHGHYAWFPLGPSSWARATEPYDIEDGESRWRARPTDAGGVRVRVENLGTAPPNRNAGFDVHLGPLGDLGRVALDVRTLATPATTGPATLFVGLYLNAGGDGDFFAWEPDGDVERFAGLGDDEEGVALFGASGTVEIDAETAFGLVADGGQATVAELQGGAVDGIDGETAAALYVGVVNGGEGVDEVVVDDVRVTRT